MISGTTRHFWGCFENLPDRVQNIAKDKFGLWKRDPLHPSLHFKELAPGLWSVRITLRYRALARKKANRVIWFWIGTHEDYDRLLRSL